MYDKRIVVSAKIFREDGICMPGAAARAAGIRLRGEVQKALIYFAESIGLIRPTPKAFPIVSPGLRAQRATLGRDKKITNPERGAEPPSQPRSICELFQSSFTHNRLDPPRALPWAEICKRLRRFSAAANI